MSGAAANCSMMSCESGEVGGFSSARRENAHRRAMRKWRNTGEPRERPCGTGFQPVLRAMQDRLGNLSHMANEVTLLHLQHHALRVAIELRGVHALQRREPRRVLALVLHADGVFEYVRALRQVVDEEVARRVLR